MSSDFFGTPGLLGTPAKTKGGKKQNTYNVFIARQGANGHRQNFRCTHECLEMQGDGGSLSIIPMEYESSAFAL